MSAYRFSHFLAAVAVAVPMTLPAQVVDRVVAVVDREVILESELNAQVQFFIQNNRLDPNTPNIKQQVLESMISEKLIIAKAIEDTITVTDDEVQQQMDAIIQQRVLQAGSEARLEEMYGMPISKIRREFRDDLRKNLLAQKLQQQRFGQTEVGRHEVEAFYATYKDSLPRVAEEVELSHIFIRPKPSDAATAATRTRLQGILDSIRAGASFPEMAKRYSEDPGSAPQGGDLGLVRRGLFVKEFESAVFSLADSQISDIVQSSFGFHVIQLLERRGEAVRARHILLKVPRGQHDDDSTIVLLDTLRSRILRGENFAELAKRYSEDTRTNLVGGSLGTFEIEQLDQIDKNLSATVLAMKEGEISKPSKLSTETSYGYHLVWLKRRTPPHVMTLDQDYRRLEALTQNYRRMKEYQTWLADLKGRFYWEIRL
jgi:peptidyl-prolyl cis-trans isomerase SurA